MAAKRATKKSPPPKRQFSVLPDATQSIIDDLEGLSIRRVAWFEALDDEIQEAMCQVRDMFWAGELPKGATMAALHRAAAERGANVSKSAFRNWMYAHPDAPAQ